LNDWHIAKEPPFDPACFARGKANPDISSAVAVRYYIQLNGFEAIERVGTFDLGGVRLTYGPDDHQGMDEAALTVVKDWRIMLIED